MDEKQSLQSTSYTLKYSITPKTDFRHKDFILKFQNQSNLKFLKDEQTIKYNGKGYSLIDYATVQSDKSIPLSCSLFYFEIEILNEGNRCEICLGISDKSMVLKKLCGTVNNSFGYCGDGKKYQEDKKEIFGVKFHKNDVVGCGVYLNKKKIFYTINGKFLGYAFENINTFKNVNFFPTVSLHSLNETIRVNFGLENFKFDIEGFYYEENKEKIEKIYQIKNSMEDLEYIIKDFLVYNQYHETFKMFENEISQQDGNKNNNEKKDNNDNKNENINNENKNKENENNNNDNKNNENNINNISENNSNNNNINISENNNNNNNINENNNDNNNNNKENNNNVNENNNNNKMDIDSIEEINTNSNNENNNYNNDIKILLNQFKTDEEKSKNKEKIIKIENERKEIKKLILNKEYEKSIEFFQKNNEKFKTKIEYKKIILCLIILKYLEYLKNSENYIKLYEYLNNLNKEIWDENLNIFIYNNNDEPYEINLNKISTLICYKDLKQTEYSFFINKNQTEILLNQINELIFQMNNLNAFSILEKIYKQQNLINNVNAAIFNDNEHIINFNNDFENNNNLIESNNNNNNNFSENNLIQSNNNNSLFSYQNEHNLCENISISSRNNNNNNNKKENNNNNNSNTFENSIKTTQYQNQLENKILSQAKKINELQIYISICEKKIKILNPNQNFPINQNDLLIENNNNNNNNNNIKNKLSIYESKLNLKQNEIEKLQNDFNLLKIKFKNIQETLNEKEKEKKEILNNLTNKKIFINFPNVDRIPSEKIYEAYNKLFEAYNKLFNDREVLINSLKSEIVNNDKQRNFIIILKQAIENSLINNEIKDKILNYENEEFFNNNFNNFNNNFNNEIIDISSFNSTIEKLKSEKNTLEEKLKNEINNLTEENENFKKKIKNSLNSGIKELEAAKNRIKFLEEEKENLIDQINFTNNFNEKLKEKVKNFENENFEINNKIKNIQKNFDEKINKIQCENNRLNNLNNELMKNRENFKENKNILNDEINKINNENLLLKKENQNLNENYNFLLNENNKIKNENQILIENLKNKENEINEIKNTKSSFNEFKNENFDFENKNFDKNFENKNFDFEKNYENKNFDNKNDLKLSIFNCLDCCHNFLEFCLNEQNKKKINLNNEDLIKLINLISKISSNFENFYQNLKNNNNNNNNENNLINKINSYKNDNKKLYKNNKKLLEENIKLFYTNKENKFYFKFISRIIKNHINNYDLKNILNQILIINDKAIGLEIDKSNIENKLEEISPENLNEINKNKNLIQELNNEINEKFLQLKNLDNQLKSFENNIKIIN